MIQRACNKLGKTTIFHVDDNVWEIPPGNPAKPIYAPGSAVMQRFSMLLQNCDWATTSTPYLRDLVIRLGKQPNVTIMKNLVEVDWIRSFMSPGRDNPEEIRLGLLLDEALAELDPVRRDDLLGRLAECEQMLLTTTDLALFPPEFVKNTTLWQVRDGRVEHA